MNAPFVILTDGKVKEVVFSYNFARKAMIFFLTVLNGTLPVVMLFSAVSQFSLWVRVTFVFALLAFEILFFLVYYPLQLTVRVDKKSGSLRITQTGPFYLTTTKQIAMSKTPFLRAEQTKDGMYPYFKYVENKESKVLDLFPYSDNDFIGSLPIFKKTLNKDEFELLGKELGVKAIPT